MGFLNMSTKVTIDLPCKRDEAGGILNDLVIIVNTLTAEEINLLSKAVQKPIIKSAALMKLREILK